MLPPTVTVRLEGVAVNVKLVTESATVVLFTFVPLVPVTVRVEFPPGVAAVVVMVMVVVPDAPGMVAGLKEAVAPGGNPLTLGVTVPVNPFTGATVMV